jgi:hypothetical protein
MQLLTVKWCRDNGNDNVIILAGTATLKCERNSMAFKVPRCISAVNKE